MTAKVCTSALVIYWMDELHFLIYKAQIIIVLSHSVIGRLKCENAG